MFHDGARMARLPFPVPIRAYGRIRRSRDRTWSARRCNRGENWLQIKARRCKENERKKAFIFFYLFLRIETFQWVMSEKNEKIADSAQLAQRVVGKAPNHAHPTWALTQAGEDRRRLSAPRLFVFSDHQATVSCDMDWHKILLEPSSPPRPSPRQRETMKRAWLRPFRVLLTPGARRG